MIRPSLLQRAKQGDPEAIAALMNLTLEPRGVTADVVRIQDCLHISFSSSRVLNKNTVIRFTRKGLKNLAAKPIHKVKLYGMKVGEELPIWVEEVGLLEAEENTATHLTPSTDDQPLVNAPSIQHPPVLLQALTQLQKTLNVYWVGFNTQAHSWLETVQPRKVLHPTWLKGLPMPMVAWQYRVMFLVTFLAFLAGGVIALIANFQPDRSSRFVIAPKQTLETSSEQEATKRQNAAKQYLMKMNQAQQDFYQKNGRFANNLEELERSLSIDFHSSSSLSFQSSDYTYRLTSPDQTQSLLTGTAKVKGLRSYVAAVLLSKSAPQPHLLVASLCETKQPAQVPPSAPQVMNGTVQCSLDSRQIP